MPDQANFIAKRPAFTILLSGFYGTGKTLQAHSFPKCYTISVDPAGLETLRQPKNESFLTNLVWYEELGRENTTDLKSLFKETAKSTERNSFYGCIEHAKELAASGDVETLIIDGGTYLCDLMWAKICELEEVRATSGMRDTQAMYRNLGLALQRLFMSQLLTVSTRNNLNLICTFHLKRESQEQMQGSDKRAAKVMSNSDIALQIEGSMRNKIEGMFGGSLYLEKILKSTGDAKALEYAAICDVSKGYGTTVLAKNRWGLPPKVSLEKHTLYEILMDTLKITKEVVKK